MAPEWPHNGTMRLRQLEFLRLVVDMGSFAAAARAAGVSQPAITQALQALERELGQPLFERLGRRKLPTPAALAVASRAGEVKDSIAAMQMPPSGDLSHCDLPAQRLRVGMSPASALLYAAAIEGVWRAMEPQGLLQVTSRVAPEMLSGLAANALDLVIAPRPRRYEVAGIRRARLYTSTPRVCCRKGHALEGATRLRDIEGAGWVVTGASGTPGNVIEEAHRVRGLAPPRVLVTCTDYPTMLGLVAQTDLLCVVPHPALLTGELLTRLRALPIAEGLPRYEVCAFWKTAGGRLPAAQLQALLVALRGEAPQP